MIEINGKQFCENCFEKETGAVCAACGFDSSDNAPDPSMLAPGSVLLNRYVIGRVIGKGGFGITYLAYDALVGKKIAVKEYFPYGIAQRTIGSTEVSVTSAESAEAFKLGAEKFYNEAKLVTRFNGNPNIVSVYDCFYENGTVYIAMEYLHGCTLKEYIREHGVFSAPKALFAAKNIVNALIVAHSASVLHRDITPDNAILCENGDIKLIDFGAARQVVAEHSQSFSVILKPGFAPPEQYRKKGNQGPWTDVYALGTTLYFMLTGDIPEDPSARFDDDDTFKENLFDIDPALWEIITKATKLNIAERYADAYELKKALDRVEITPEPIIVPDESPNAGAELQPEAVENVGKMTVSIKPMKPKRSFFRRHLRTFIEITCGLLAAAIIIPLAAAVYRPAVDIASDPSPSAGDDGSASDGGAVATIGNRPDLSREGFTKPLYSCLSGADKELYEIIYTALRASEKTIVLPSLTYQVGDIDEFYEDVLNDNPLLNHTRGYNLNYNDLNNNKEPDPDEYVNSISPIYTGVDIYEALNYIGQDLNEHVTYADLEESIEFLCYTHDKILNETLHVARNSRTTASTTHGVVIDHAADDLGVARTLCDYAQRMGFESFVVDTDDIENYSAYVRIKINGAWYNINPWLNSITNRTITKVPVAEDGMIDHYRFLFSDFLWPLINRKTIRDFDEKYSPILPDPNNALILEGIEDDTPIEEYPTINYYIEEHLGKKYYFWEGAVGSDFYGYMLEDTKSAVDRGEKTFEVYMVNAIVESLWEVMEERYISDLAEKYGITVSGFTGEYAGDALRVTLEM